MAKCKTDKVAFSNLPCNVELTAVEGRVVQSTKLETPFCTAFGAIVRYPSATGSST